MKYTQWETDPESSLSFEAFWLVICEQCGNIFAAESGVWPHVCKLCKHYTQKSFKAEMSESSGGPIQLY